jgi:hypothetical protein
MTLNLASCRAAYSGLARLTHESASVPVEMAAGPIIVLPSQLSARGSVFCLAQVALAFRRQIADYTRLAEAASA